MLISYFEDLMRFMGDQPGLKKQDKMDYIYDILQVCGSCGGFV